jgi:hypothetical protein
VKKLLVSSIVALSFPAVASVGRLESRRPASREPIAAVEAGPKPEPRVIRFDGIAHVLDGVTVMELDETEAGKHVRRVVLKPDFQGGPGAALTVRF